MLLCVPLFGAHDRLLLIDTGFNDHYTYKNFLELARSVGFKAEMKSFYHVDLNAVDAYGCVIINLDASFVEDYCKNKDALHKASPVTQEIIALISGLTKKKNRLVGFMLPSKMGSTIKSSCQNIFDLALPFFQENKVVKKSLCSFLQELMQSDSKRSVRYHTTLLTKHEKNEKIVEPPIKLKIPNCIDEITNTIMVGHLPFHKYHALPPLAWYCADNKIGKNFFITKASLMLFSDIGENFIYNPLDFSLRFERLKELQQLLYELYKVCIIGKFSKTSTVSSLVVPHIFSKKYLLDAKKKLSACRSCHVDKSLYEWIERDLIWCGWGALDVYDKESAVQSIVASGLNLIWLQMNPESYLSQIGLKKNEKSSFFKRISQFTALLKEASLHGPIPHFFVGTEVTSNYLNVPVKNHAIDLFGNVYTKIPSPLDFDNFWKPEVLDVFDKVVSVWPSISHGVPLAGIFFDLEMYHAQDQVGHYLTHMDFSDCAWQEFCKVHSHKKCLSFHDTQTRVIYLLKNNLFDYYFATLQKKAYEIGRRIKEHIAKKLPNGLIAVYDIHLPHTWFYKGFLAGLSSQKKPIILATFNNDFYCHYPWLVKNSIYAYHLPVLLLSKFKKVKDFNLIKEIAQFHDGAWFNRISRLEESRDPKDWPWDYGVEVTPLSTDLFVTQLREKIIEIQKENYTNYTCR